MAASRRFAVLATRDINKETYVTPWPEAGLIVTDSPYDPAPSLRIDNGKIVEMDGKAAADFDAIDTFIASYGIDLAVPAAPLPTPPPPPPPILVDPPSPP